MILAIQKMHPKMVHFNKCVYYFYIKILLMFRIMTITIQPYLIHVMTYLVG